MGGGAWDRSARANMAREKYKGGRIVDWIITD